MIPDWMNQVLWFVAGVFATGAVWYFLSQKNYHAALWSGFAAAMILLLNVTLLIRNNLISHQAESAARPSESSLSREVFHTRFHTGVRFKYPGALMYLYDSSLGKRLAPVGYAMVMEVTNISQTIARVQAYTVDIPVNGEWIRLPNLRAVDPTAFFWAKNGDLRNVRRIDFQANGFDPQARNKSLQPGEGIKGWVFLEWPPELRDTSPKFDRIRLQIDDAIGRRTVATLDTEIAEEPGESLLGGGELIVGPQESLDLSKTPILPHMDLLNLSKEKSSP